MLHIALFEPEIPPNTGNIIRLCANMGAQLHLIHPLGFTIDNKQLKRAGLDYRDATLMTEYKNYQDFLTHLNPQRIFACTTKATTCYANIQYSDNDVFLFGPETRGLPKEILGEFNNNRKIKIPMIKTSRSINLANAASIIIYEAWRQLGFKIL